MIEKLTRLIDETARAARTFQGVLPFIRSPKNREEVLRLARLATGLAVIAARLRQEFEAEEGVDHTVRIARSGKDLGVPYRAVSHTLSPN